MTALYVVLGVLFVLAITYLILTAPRSRNKRAGMEKLRVDYAHRGLWGGDIPENSIPAFAAAAAEGYGIELDVRLSADRQVVVFHDYKLSRMCGDDVRVDSLSGAALSWRRLGNTEYTIPLLEDALTTVKGRVPVLIELKGENSNTELCDALSRVLGHYDGKVCVQSFNPYLLGWFKKNQPRVARGLLYTNYLKNTSGKRINDIILGAMLTNFIARPDFIAVNEDCLNSIPVKLLTKLHKTDVFVWTVRDPHKYAKYKSLGYNCIFEGFLPANGNK
ncbi:MAG: glycerophosphodiester phosphodiesterase [Clostridiales bacterium]|nr:glycerophosphodiester phosphodiesterase [Clostridiales bacterium]